MKFPVSLRVFLYPIDENVKVLAKDTSLPDWIQDSFTDTVYKTVETTEDIIVYRYFGGDATANGAFVTTLSSTDKVVLREQLALLPEWNNTLESMATIKIPKGTTINVGKVAEQTSKTDQVFKGGADQILMPQNWSDEWIIDINPLD